MMLTDLRLPTIKVSGQPFNAAHGVCERNKGKILAHPADSISTSSALMVRAPNSLMSSFRLDDLGTML